MKKYALWVKCLTFILAVVLLLCVAVSGLGILMAESMNMYLNDTYEEWHYDQNSYLANELAYQMLREYSAELSDSPQWLLEQTGYLYGYENVKQWYNLAENEWYYNIKDENGKVVQSTDSANVVDPIEFVFQGMKAQYPVIVRRVEQPQTTVPMAYDAGEWDVTEPMVSYYENDEQFWDPNNGDAVYVRYLTTTSYQVTVGISTNYAANFKNHGMPLNMLKCLFSAKYALIAIAAVSFLLFIVAFVFVMSLAGKSPRTEEVTPKFLNRLPLDLYLVVAIVSTVLGGMAIYELLNILSYERGPVVLAFVLICSCGVGIATVDIGFFTALAAQCKVPGGFWWRHSICGRVFKWLCKAGKFVMRGIHKLLRMLPIIWQWITVGSILGILLLLICVGSTSHWYTIIPMFLWCLLFAAVVIYCGWCYGRIRTGIQRMNEGNLNEKINTKWMYGSFKTLAEDLNALADVAAIAAEKQLKSERMKTELITNVSHDIKTPLTSVINYVDLLQQPHTEEEGAQYLEVLSRQSTRLKKLVEDLMDMSKASSGNVTVNIEKVDAVEAVNQALGEFADKLEAAHLIPVFHKPDGQLMMRADGRLIWRVLSNLLSNVVKYALPGTRVYIDLMQQDKSVLLSVKNISREELNISAEELTERFVRGDTSRNTEGSGLGLNIAQSLMQLQKGNLELTVDGDLFKVTLSFPTE